MNKSASSCKYWLMKSEPDVFSLEDLQKNKTTLWEGVRNYQARNFMMTDMRCNDKVLFYHSNAEEPFVTGIAGLAEVSKLAMPDPSQFDKKSDYFDPKASLIKPIWFCVEVKFVKAFKQTLSLSNLRTIEELKKMLVLRKGQRLSIQPVEFSDYEWICQNYT